VDNMTREGGWRTQCRAIGRQMAQGEGWGQTTHARGWLTASGGSGGQWSILLAEGGGELKSYLKIVPQTLPQIVQKPPKKMCFPRRFLHNLRYDLR
jgi:hypothetical protein